MVKKFAKTKRKTEGKRDIPVTSSTDTENSIAMYDPTVYNWQKNLFGPLFPTPRDSAPVKTTATSLLYSIKNFLETNEDAKVAIFSIMVLLFIFWTVKTMLSLVFNLVCPLLILLIGVLCIPPLRQPILGDNYPAVANFVRGILMKIADSI
ncbi:uncharacterized protein LOC121730165 [Aricia agestis]|uniref:uncharacterized protein LOC121730165 n=1 Tax=Aricia agestis TaxID=91739 RepID=UPI001C208278|nr:uncharacterized protein LOC121730165 [Aricia agestis]